MCQGGLVLCSGSVYAQLATGSSQGTLEGLLTAMDTFQHSRFLNVTILHLLAIYDNYNSVAHEHVLAMSAAS